MGLDSDQRELAPVLSAAWAQRYIDRILHATGRCGAGITLIDLPVLNRDGNSIAVRGDKAADALAACALVARSSFTFSPEVTQHITEREQVGDAPVQGIQLPIQRSPSSAVT